ncbi:type 1 fimbrial protein [Candidatus Pantoea alvi]|uniref:fimbrial protein n=1 Tax=Enterobacter agglomerans TaxID=549 RepID=UPI000CDE260F|nr:fimbrial protein [Pantoea agglomerans]POW55414.1 type 1 fimbrial protein [Pantoea alvi]UBN55741.1 type 1 fimbrial protein [Pantoea agglomerans]
MKTKFTLSTLTLFIGGLFISASANAASENTINFQGEVADETCSIAVNGNTATPVVSMPTVSKKELAASGATAGQTSFTVGLTGCTGGGGSSTKVSTVFIGNNVSSTGNLLNAGTAQNVEVQLLDPADAVINLTGGYTGNGDLTLATGATEASATYNAQYYATDAVTAGTVTASLQYAVTYQ